MACLYILRSQANGRFYIGSTSDLERRLAEHQRGHSPWTRARGPWRLVYREDFPNLKDARRRERQIKAWKSRLALLKLIGGG
jgi:putative endonuclease